MSSSLLIENLMTFNLTRQEAIIYEALLTHGEMTGYEVAKETGIARSNVYSALQSLVEKGVLYLLEGETTKYIPVETETFLKNSFSELEEKAKIILANKPQKHIASEGYMTIVGGKNILEKIHEMLEKTKERLYVFAPQNILKDFEQDLEKLVEAEKKVVILSDDFEVYGAICHKTQCEKGQIRLITDSSYVLTGVISGDEHDTCLYSGEKNLVDVMKEALKNKIELLGK